MGKHTLSSGNNEGMEMGARPKTPSKVNVEDESNKNKDRRKSKKGKRKKETQFSKMSATQIPEKFSNDSPTGKSRSLPNRSTGRPPTTSVLRSAIYYQNRIIVPEVKTRSAKRAARDSNRTLDEVDNSNGPRMNGPSSIPSHRYTAENSDTSINRTTTASAAASQRLTTLSPEASRQVHYTSGSRNSGVNATDDQMDSRGIDIIVTDTETGLKQHKVKKKSLCKRITRLLQDNRMKGVPNAEAILAVGNPQDYRKLKTALNVIFLTIGIALLVAVVVVIMYTAIDTS